MGTTQPQLAQNLEDINSSSQKPEKHVNSEHKMKEQEDKIPSETIHIYTKMKQSTNKQDIDKVVYIKRYFDLVNNQTWCFNSEDDHGDDGYGWFVGLVDEAIGLRTLKLICRGHTSAMLRSITELKMPNLLKLCLSHCRLQTIQFLPNLRSPCLRQLYLDNNYISSIKPLRRMSCNISILNIKNNRIYSIEDNLIWMISFNAQEIEGINIEQRCDRSHSLGESIDWIFKLPTQTIIRLDMEAQSRISITMYKYNLIKKKYVGQNGIFLWGPNHSHISRNYNAHFY